MTTPDAASFDDWYRAIGASPRWDAFMRERLSLPPGLQSSGYLTGPGLVEVLALLGLAPGSTLVELGCGRGGYGMAAAHAAGARLVGVDFSDVAVTEARHQAARRYADVDVEFRMGDLTATGLAAGSADAVLCVDAFHFVRPPKAAALECRRLLRPGARLVLTTWEPVTRGDPELPERLRHLDVGHELTAAGFVDVRVETRPDWWQVELALWQAAAELAPAGDPAIAGLVEEATELIPLAGSLRRVLVTARTPSPQQTSQAGAPLNTPRPFEVHESGALFHGTKADLAVGDLLVPGRRSNFGGGRTANHVYVTATLDAAAWGAELAAGEGRSRIYIVEPTGSLEDDPNVTDKKFPGNPTRSYRTQQPVTVVGELLDWVGHPAEQLQAMRDGLADLDRRGLAVIDD